MKTVLATSAALEKFVLSSRSHDPRLTALLAGARDLGITTIRNITVSDLVFVVADLDYAARGFLHDVLVEPLLQVGQWVSQLDGADDHAPDSRVIESMLLP